MSEMLLHRFKYSQFVALIVGCFVFAVFALSGRAKEVGSNPAGPSSQVAGRVEGEISNRISQMKEATGLIQEGDAAMTNKDYEKAVEKFRRAVALIPEAPMVAKHREMAMRRYADASVLQARQLGQIGRFVEANSLLDAVLDVSMMPDHDGANTLKQQLKDPDRFNPAMTPEFPEKVAKVNKLLVLAGGLVDLGQFDAAKAAYNQILAVDAHNVAARRGLEKCEKFIADYAHAARDHTRARSLREVDEKWGTAVPESTLTPKLPNENLSGMLATTTSKLRGIIFKRLNFDAAPLSEVVQFIATKSRDLDIVESDGAKKGINMIVKISAGEQAKLPNITLDIVDTPLAQALDYIAEQSGTKWKLADGIISFTTIAVAGGKMNTRSFSVAPGFLSGAPSGAGADAAAPGDPFSATPASGGGLAVQKVTAQSFLEGYGVPFPQGASAHFDRGSSRLTVTNTDENLDAIQGIIEQIGSTTTKQALVGVTVMKISHKDLKELGFDLLLGQFNIGSKLFGSGGTYGNQGTPVSPGQDYPFLDPTAGNGAIPTGQLPLTGGLRTSGQIESLPSIDDLLKTNRYTSAASTRTPAIFGLIGQFTDPQFQFVMRALNQKTGKDLLNSTEILVKSGQIASAKAVRDFPYPTDFDPPQIPQTVGAGIGGGGIGNNGGAGQLGDTGFAPVTPTTPTTFKTEEVGNVLEVEATIAEDGSSVDLRLAPGFTEFLGFINYGSSINSVINNEFVELTSNIIVQPVFDRIRAQTNVTVYDGATLMLGGLQQSRVSEIEDKTPIFGDIPLIGRLFRSKVTESTRTAIIMFVTVKVVDPAGRRLHAIGNGAESAKVE